jgi:hypothetical protein
MPHQFGIFVIAAALGVSTCVGAQADEKSLSSTTRVARSSCIPPSIPGFETVAFPEAYLAAVRDQGNGTVAGYSAELFELAVTVFIYDREADSDTDDELERAVSEVVAAHLGAELASGGNGSVPLSGKPIPARGGIFLWEEDDKEYGSLLWLVPRPKHYVKFRATYNRIVGKEAEAMSFAIQSINTIASALCTPE